MSAAVLALPTAATAPVAQRRRRGPLPKTVLSLSAYRADQEKARVELQARNIALVKDTITDVLARVFRGEVTGLAIVERRLMDDEKKGTSAMVSGELGRDYDDLRTQLESFIDLSWDWTDEDLRRKQKSDSFIAAEGVQS